MTVNVTFRRALQFAVIAIVLAGGRQIAYGQQPSLAAIATDKQIIAVTKSMNAFDPLIGGVVEQAKLLYLQQNPGQGKELNEIAEKLRNDLKPRFAEIENEVAKEYAINFTEPELKAILVFYQSPAGLKLIERQPLVINSSMRFAQEWANKLSEEVIKKMQEELKK